MHSCVSLVHFGVGEVQLNDMRVENALLAPFLYFAFVLLVVLIMINMFLAIINDAYRQVTKERVEVSLPVVMRSAARRQLARVARRIGGAAGRRFAERVEREKSEAEAAAEAEAKEEEVEAMMAAERAKTTASHLYAAGEVTNELKALCFRQDRGERGASATLRASFNTALDELERLRQLNDQLRRHALRFGWEWDAGMQALVVSKSRKEGAQAIDEAAAARLRRRRAAEDVDTASEGEGLVLREYGGGAAKLVATGASRRGSGMLIDALKDAKKGKRQKHKAKQVRRASTLASWSNDQAPPDERRPSQVGE